MQTSTLDSIIKQGRCDVQHTDLLHKLDILTSLLFRTVYELSHMFSILNLFVN